MNKTVEMLRKLEMPWSIAAERAVLGLMLRDADFLGESIDCLDADDFYYFRHRIIFLAMRRLVEAGQELDDTSVRSVLQEHNALEGAGGDHYLDGLTAIGVDRETVGYWFRLLKNVSLMRRLAHAGAGIMRNACMTHPDDDAPLEQALRTLRYLVRDVERMRDDDCVVSQMFDDCSWQPQMDGVLNNTAHYLCSAICTGLAECRWPELNAAIQDKVTEQIGEPDFTIEASSCLAFKAEVVALEIIEIVPESWGVRISSARYDGFRLVAEFEFTVRASVEGVFFFDENDCGADWGADLSTTSRKEGLFSSSAKIAFEGNLPESPRLDELEFLLLDSTIDFGNVMPDTWGW